MDIPLDHFEGGMAENLLEGVHVAAILKIPRCDGMPEQMGMKPGDAGFPLELAGFG